MAVSEDDPAVTGECGDPIVYRKDLRPLLLRYGILGTILCITPAMIDLRLAGLFLLAVAMMIWRAIGIEREITVLVSARVFEYRCPDDTVTVRIADIASIEEMSKVYGFGARQALVPGVKLLLRSGEERVVPLDFPERAKILARLRDSLRSGRISPTSA